MSTLSQFVGGGIKSIQTGSTSGIGQSGGATVTISAVNTAKSIVILRGVSNTGGYVMASLSFLSSTQISITGSGNANGTVAWTVAEFY